MLGVLTLLSLIAVYFLPSIIALATRKKNKLAILVLNLTLGWTGIGWIGSLVWSVVKD